MRSLTERLELVMKEKAWDHADVVRISGQTSSVVSQWLGKGSKEIKSIKKMEAAMRLSEASGFCALWIAEGKGPERALPKESLSDSAPYTVNPYSDTKMILAPVVEWARLGTDLYKDNKEVIASRFEAIPAGSKPNTKWVEVEADMPRLMLSRGDLVLITPVSGQHECKESKMHLFKTVGGAYFLGTFRRLASGFEAIPDSGPALESEKHGVQVVGIKHGHIESI